MSAVPAGSVLAYHTPGLVVVQLWSIIALAAYIEVRCTVNLSTSGFLAGEAVEGAVMHICVSNGWTVDDGIIFHGRCH
jgi:hypothetical protein